MRIKCDIEINKETKKQIKQNTINKQQLFTIDKKRMINKILGKHQQNINTETVKDHTTNDLQLEMDPSRIKRIITSAYEKWAIC